MTEDQKIAKRARDAQRKREKRAAEKATKSSLVEGQRVHLKADEAEEWAAEEALVVEVNSNGTVTVQVDPNGPHDDGLREVTQDQLEDAQVDPELAAALGQVSIEDVSARQPIASAEVTKVLHRAGFSFIRTEQGASGYSRADGCAVLVQALGAWTLRFADGTQTGGASQNSLLALLAKMKTPKSLRVEAARARGKQGAAELGTNPVVTIPAVQALDIIAGAKEKATEQAEARVIAAAEGRPLNVVRAVEMLRSLTNDKFDVQNLRGDKHYGDRMALLRVLFDRERGGVKVAETGINNVVQAFHRALGAVGNCTAAKDADFEARCGELLTKVHAAQLAAGKAAKKSVKAARRAVAPSLTVSGIVLSAPKRLGRKAQKVADDAVRREVYVEALEVELKAMPKPVLGGLDVIQAHSLRLLDHPGDLVSLKLERCNSQGALHVWPSANGRRLCCGVLTPALAVGVTAQPYDLEVILAQVDTWLGDEFEKSEEMEDTLKKVKVAVKRQLEPVKLVPTSLPIPGPRDGSPEPRITAASVRLLEDPRVGIILMQLEKENSQGALCVYNNSSRVRVGVVPPEILKTLRPVPGEVDLVKAANQLLNPVIPSVPVTPVAVGYLTAVLHCKEIATMSKKFEAPVIEKPSKKFEAPVIEKPSKKFASKTATVEMAKKTLKAEKDFKITKKASAKPEVVKKSVVADVASPRKASTFKLVNATKPLWSAFTKQKGEVVAGLVALGAVGVKSHGVTGAELCARLSAIAPKNVRFYLSVWQHDNIIEKLA